MCKAYVCFLSAGMLGSLPQGNAAAGEASQATVKFQGSSPVSVLLRQTSSTAGTAPFSTCRTDTWLEVRAESSSPLLLARKEASRLASARIPEQTASCTRADGGADELSSAAILQDPSELPRKAHLIYGTIDEAPEGHTDSS